MLTRDGATMKFRLIAAIAAVCALLVGAVEVQAAGAQSPLGFKIFCLKYPNECKAGSKGSLPMTDATMQTLKRVNLQVNNAIRPKHDNNGKDVWTLNASSGDCEDYVITKRSRLIKMGLPAGALRIAYAKTRSGEGHAILIVKTSQGDFVLDNRTNAIKLKAQAGLRVISMSGANPKSWSGA